MPMTVDSNERKIFSLMISLSDDSFYNWQKDSIKKNIGVYTIRERNIQRRVIMMIRKNWCDSLRLLKEKRKINHPSSINFSPFLILLIRRFFFLSKIILICHSWQISHHWSLKKRTMCKNEWKSTFKLNDNWRWIFIWRKKSNNLLFR